VKIIVMGVSGCGNTTGALVARELGVPLVNLFCDSFDTRL